MNFISTFIIPIFVFSVVIYGFLHKVDIYESFLGGAKEGLVMTFHIAPAIIAMIFATNLFLNSHFLEWAFQFMNPIFQTIHVPIEILPMAVVRPISGTASLAILNNILLVYGPDSFVGRLASTLQGCTDTTIYVLALYFGSIKVTKTKHALGAGLFADLVGIIASFIIVSIFF
ncbi:MAG: spore maturation protein [Bacilli bacterium]|jgi:spore maturation protein B|nr:spore maturation protein [Bacilli bacterium]